MIKQEVPINYDIPLKNSVKYLNADLNSDYFYIPINNCKQIVEVRE